MVRIRHGLPVFALALALVAACKKDEKKSDPATGDKAGEKATGDKLAEKAPTPGATASGDDLSLLPIDSELVLGINITQIQQSALWKQLVAPQLMTGERTTQLGEFKAKCGFDPMTAVTALSVGMKNLSGGKPDGVVVLHGVDKAKSWACLDKMKDEMAKDGTEFSRDGDVGLFKASDGPPVAMTFINDTTVVAVMGEKATAAGVKEVAAGGSKLKGSPTFLEMYSKVKTGDSLWGLMNGKSPVFEKMGSIGVKATAVFGSLNVTDGLALDLRLRVETPEGATQLTTMSKAQLGQAEKMFDQVDVSSEGSDVKYKIVLSNQKLQELIAQFAPMLGAFGGMGSQ